jgi:cell division protein FtsB
MSRRTRLLLIGLVVVLGVLVASVVLPTTTWFGQRRALDQASAQLRQLESSNSRLAAKIDKQSDNSSVERQAREQFGFVMPGEESYIVPGSPPPVVNLPQVWPFNLLQDPIARAAARQK